MATYGTWRFIIEYLRGDYRGSVGLPITPSQLIAILMIVGAFGVFFLEKRITDRLEKAEEDEDDEEEPEEEGENSAEERDDTEGESEDAENDGDDEPFADESAENQPSDDEN